MSKRLTHLDQTGTARMVDVGAKPATQRMAKAGGIIRMSSEAMAAIKAGDADLMISGGNFEADAGILDELESLLGKKEQKYPIFPVMGLSNSD